MYPHTKLRLGRPKSFLMQQGLLKTSAETNFFRMSCSSLSNIQADFAEFSIKTKVKKQYNRNTPNLLIASFKAFLKRFRTILEYIFYTKMKKYTK